jgi:hypothetical protein
LFILFLLVKCSGDGTAIYDYRQVILVWARRLELVDGIQEGDHVVGHPLGDSTGPAVKDVLAAVYHHSEHINTGVVHSIF